MLKFVFIIFKKGCIFSIKWFVVLKLDNFFFCYIVYCICIIIKYRNDGIYMEDGDLIIYYKFYFILGREENDIYNLYNFWVNYVCC